MELYALRADMRLKAVFIRNLRMYRKSRGISQMILADKCGTSTAYIGQIEIGNRFPSINMIEKISAALQVKPYELFMDEPHEEIAVKITPLKQDIMSEAAKDELIKSLTAAIHRVVKRTR